ncbi:MAG: 4'-phosphopantetheinyl transferase superfamily protein [Solirubrobacteraceae bacterium]|jgi:hypothetical protein
MSEITPARVRPIAGGPDVWLLNATRTGLDEAGLRAWARERTSAAGLPHGSRSYRFPYALAVSHDARVGIDIERVEPADRRFLASISTPIELATVVADAGLDAYATSLWSSKEALAKALGDALRYDPRRLRSPIDWPGGRAGAWRASILAAPPGHVAWLCWRCAPAA